MMWWSFMNSLLRNIQIDVICYCQGKLYNRHKLYLIDNLSAIFNHSNLLRRRFPFRFSRIRWSIILQPGMNIIQWQITHRFQWCGHWFWLYNIPISVRYKLLKFVLNVFNYRDSNLLTSSESQASLKASCSSPPKLFTISCFRTNCTLTTTIALSAMMKSVWTAFQALITTNSNGIIICSISCWMNKWT